MYNAVKQTSQSNSKKTMFAAHQDM